jgi:hypothetical protein
MKGETEKFKILQLKVLGEVLGTDYIRQTNKRCSWD